MKSENEGRDDYLGQFIPLHYHHNMLMDSARMKGFKAAIDHVVFPGAKVLELGGGTGALSWFAAAKAGKVWCVEFNPDLVAESRRLLAKNPNGEKVEVVHADAFEYLPPERVDVVICEMIHAAMLREKQIEMIESFKQRYIRQFGGPLPVMVPTAVVMAVQPLQQDYNFEGYMAPIIQVHEPSENLPGTIELSQPSAYAILDFTQNMPLDIAWEGTLQIEHSGTFNALRFMTKNILAIIPETSSSIDWTSLHMALPLAEPLAVTAGSSVRVSFNYRAGGMISSLSDSLKTQISSG